MHTRPRRGERTRCSRSWIVGRRAQCSVVDDEQHRRRRAEVDQQLGGRFVQAVARGRGIRVAAGREGLRRRVELVQDPAEVGMTGAGHRPSLFVGERFERVPERLREGLERQLDRLGARPVEHDAVPPVRGACELRDEPGLAGPWLPADQHDLPASLPGGQPGQLQALPLGRAGHERDGRLERQQVGQWHRHLAALGRCGVGPAHLRDREGLVEPVDRLVAEWTEGVTGPTAFEQPHQVRGEHLPGVGLVAEVGRFDERSSEVLGALDVRLARGEPDPQPGPDVDGGGPALEVDGGGHRRRGARERRHAGADEVTAVPGRGVRHLLVEPAERRVVGRGRARSGGTAAGARQVGAEHRHCRRGCHGPFPACPARRALLRMLTSQI